MVAHVDSAAGGASWLRLARRAGLLAALTAAFAVGLPIAYALQHQWIRV